MNETIGVITNIETGVFQRDVIAGVREVMDAHGYAVTVDSVAPTPNTRRPVALDMSALAGVIVIADVLPDDALRAIIETECPVTLVSHHTDALPAPAVMSDNIDGMRLLVSHLVDDCQRERFVFVQGLSHQRDGAEREWAFRQEIMRRAITLDTVHFMRGDFEADVVRESAQALLAETHDFNAVVAADYLMALEMIDALNAAGLRVPDDVSVVGFGDAAIAAERGLTTVAADIQALGRRSARQLLGQMRGLRIHGKTILGTQLLVRASSLPTTTS